MSSKEYHQSYHKNWYSKNKIVRAKQIHDRRNAIRLFLVEYRKTLSCIKCGESHPATLDFHHRDKSQKDLDISTATRNGWGEERLMREIDKCDVLCSNCHRKEHFILV